MKKLFTTSIIFFLIILSSKLFAQPSAQLAADTAEYPYWVTMMQDPDANFYSIQSAFNKYWQNRPIIRGSGWKPFKRWEYMMQSRINPDGSMPAPDAVLKAYQNYNSRYDSKLSLNGNWVNQGPFGIPGAKGYRGLGRINAVAFHPTDPNTIYVGAPSGGFWYSTTGGNNWVTTTDNLPTLGVSAIAIDPQNPSVIYIGTGDRDAGDAPGLGVMKSLDGGHTWIDCSNGMGNRTVGELLIDPRNPSVLLAGTNSGIYKSIDGGLNWTVMITGNFKNMIFKPGNPDVVYATAAGSYYKSNDLGESWQRITSGIGVGARGVIGVTPANPEVVYFMLSKNDYSFSGMYYSSNGGDSFTEMSTTPNILNWDCGTTKSGGQSWYDLAIAADPVNPDVVLIGGINIWKSTDRGATWQISAHWSGGCGAQTVHADQHVFKLNPLDNRIYCGNDGGIYYTSDAGGLWTEITTGLAISQAYKIGQSATNDQIVMNGYQDNGTTVFEDGEWTAVTGGDGMECAVDPKDPEYRYSTLYYGDIFRIRGHNNEGSIAGQDINGITEEGLWVTPFLIDKKNPNEMFVGYKGVWRSRNIKASSTSDVTWKKISNNISGAIAVLEQSPVNTQVMYAAVSGALYRCLNAQDDNPVWSGLSKLLPSGTAISDIECSPWDEKTLYITQDKKVYKSADQGLTWTDITGTFPEIHINSIVCYKNSQEGLYLGTDAGVYYRDRSMTDWILYNNGLPVAVKVTELEIYYDPASPAGDRIKAGTYGRGLWSSDMYTSAPLADFEVSLRQIPKECVVDFKDLSLGVPSHWTWEFEGGDPSVSHEASPKQVNYYYAGDYKVKLTVSNANGSDSATRTGYIHVSDTTRPIPGFYCSPAALCDIDQVVSFTDTSAFCPVSWLWTFTPNTVTFVNGTNASSQNPEVKFNKPGLYTVSLKALNSNGSRMTIRHNAIAAGGMQVPYNEDFESPLQLSGWSIENPDNETTWKIIQLGEGVNTSKVITMNFFNYPAPAGRRDRLISPPLNFSGSGPLFLSFDHAYASRFSTYSDSLILYISEDCGGIWKRIFKAGEKGQGTFATVERLTTSFIPITKDDWCGGESWGSPCFVIDLSEYSGKSNMRLAFESYNRFGNNLYIDNISISSTTPLAHNPKANPVSIYPNPSTGTFTLTSEKAVGRFDVTILDAQGRKVFTQKFSPAGALNQTLQPGNLRRGIYFVVLIGNNLTEKLRLIIQ